MPRPPVPAAKDTSRARGRAPAFRRLLAFHLQNSGP